MPRLREEVRLLRKEVIDSRQENITLLANVEGYLKRIATLEINNLELQLKVKHLTEVVEHDSQHSKDG